MKKLNVAVVFGGRSGELEVSLVSAGSVMKNLDRKKYNVIPVGITKEGMWIAGTDSLQLLKSGDARKGLRTLITPDATIGTLETVGQCDVNRKGGVGVISRQIDVVFPVMHGTYGEDGAIQGLLEMSNLPYVGSGVLGSAVAMDKVMQMKLCGATGLF